MNLCNTVQLLLAYGTRITNKSIITRQPNFSHGHFRLLANGITQIKKKTPNTGLVDDENINEITIKINLPFSLQVLFIVLKNVIFHKL